MNNSRTQYLVAFLLLLVALVTMQYVVSPVQHENGSLETNVAQVASENDALKSQIADLEQVKQSTDSLSEVERTQLLSAVPVELKQDELLIDLNLLASNHNMTVQNVSFAPASQDQDGVRSVLMNANFVGTYADLVEFLKSVEENTRKMVVKTISVQVGTSDEGASSVNFALQIEAFYQS